MQKFQDVVLDSQGRPVPGAVIAVQAYPSGTPATVYQTNSVGAAYTPTTDAFGAFYFYGLNGRYTYTVTVAGVLRGTVTDVLLYDPEETSGSFTFADASGGTPVPGSNGDGTYIKQGALVYITGRWRWNTNGQTVAAVISGLPFVAKAGSYPQAITVAEQGNTTWNGTNGALGCYTSAGTTNLIFRWIDRPGLTVEIGQLDIAYIYLSGWYLTN